jgi:alanine dehydrogenase
MIVGVPKEVKNSEFRVSMVPAGVDAMVKAGHTVLVERSAGVGSGIEDEHYLAAGAVLKDTAEEVWGESDMIVKVKEPLPQEYPLIKKGQILFTYLHLAPAPELTKALLARECIGVAYETVRLADGSLPLLTPMSEVAGRMATQVGAATLGKSYGGRGVLLGGVPGVKRGVVTVIGGGVVGVNAAKIAVGMGAQVSILDVNHKRLAYLDDVFGNSISTIMSNSENIAQHVAQSDLVVGAVLIPGAKAPWLVSREMLGGMRKNSVLVDVAIDQGGCFETSKPTSHADPTYVVDDVIHYCVANIPGEVAHTSTYALTNVTLPYALQLAAKGAEQAALDDKALAEGVNVYKGKLTCGPVAEAVGETYTSLDACLQ